MTFWARNSDNVGSSPKGAEREPAPDGGVSSFPVQEDVLSADVEFEELIEREKKKDLGGKDTYCNLQARDGTIIRTYIHGRRTVRTDHRGGKLLTQWCLEYGPEFIQYLAGELRYRQQRGFDNIVMVTGPERSGKSTFAQHLAMALDPNFPAEHVTFKIKDFNHVIATAPEGSTIIMDEAGIDMYSQEWWDEFQVELVKKLFVIGVKHLTLILVIPHRLDLNKKIRDRRVHYWVNVAHTPDSLDRGYAVIRKAVVSEWVQDIFWDIVAWCRFGPLSGPAWDEYEKKKMSFVDEINSGEYGRRSSRDNPVRDKAIYALKQAGMSQSEIARQVGLHQTTVGDILTKEGEKRRVG